MPITMLINRLNEVASMHANVLGIGFDVLATKHQTWVLSRVAIEIKLYPGVNNNYTLRTWVSAVNRLFSERDFEILVEGEVVGYARTVWAVLDTETRTAADISDFLWMSTVIPTDKKCPIDKPSRPIAVDLPTRSDAYQFTFCDLDVNRHVNSSRYIELLLNQWSLDFHDRNRLTRFEIAYMHEAYYDEAVEVRLAETNTEHKNSSILSVRAELINGNTPLCRSLLIFSPR